LPATFREAIREPANPVFLSVASVWEVVVKHRLGKLPLSGEPAEIIPRQRALHQIASLPLAEDAFPHLAGLPLLHRDPFDRIPIAQSLQHDLVIATVDAAIRAYPVKLLATA
jgi:PIN domain nuclease of toxin-antitoxin system